MSGSKWTTSSSEPRDEAITGIPADEAFRPEHTARAVLAKKIASVVGRTDFARVRRNEDGTVEALRGGAGTLTTVTRAHGIVVVPRELEGLEEGASVTVELL